MSTLITGATGGLGRAFVHECAKKGQDLVLSATNQERLEAFADELRKEYSGLNVVCKACDLSLETDRANLMAFLGQNNITIDFLINNAGYIAEGEFLAHSDEEIMKIVRVNCEGTIDLTQKIIKARDKAAPLNILTVSSMAGFYPMPYMAIYAATKAFLKSIMVALSVELKDKNVFITTICPSGIPTTDAMKDAIKAQGFNGKITMSSPEDVAKLGLKAMKKHKALVIPKSVNRFVRFVSRFAGERALAKTTGKMWKKSQDKRNFKKAEDK